MSDAWSAGLWFFVNCLLLHSLWRLVGGLFPDRSQWRLMAPTLVFHWCVCVLSSFLSNLFSAVCFSSFFALTLFATSMALFACRRLPPPQPACETVETKIDKLFVFGLWLVIALISTRAFFESTNRFPSDWDTLMYHLPLVTEWAQTGTLYARGCPVWHNSANLEVLGLWLAVPFSGDFLVQCASLYPVVLLFLGTIETGLQLRFPRWLSLVMALSVVGAPICSFQLGNLKNDIAVAALLSVTIAYGLDWAKACSKSSLLVASASLGLLAGVKYYSLGYAGVAVFYTAIQTYRNHGHRKVVTWLFSAASGMGLLAGYWFVRNAVHTGSPLYPMQIFGHRNEQETLRPGTLSSTLIGSGNFSLLGEFVDHVVELGGTLQAAFLLAPFVLLIPISRSICQRDQSLSDRRVPLVALVLGTALVLGITPFIVNPDDSDRLAQPIRSVRFGQCFLWCLIVAGAESLFVLSELSRNRSLRIVLSFPIWLFGAFATWQFMLIATEWVKTDAVIMMIVVVDFSLVGMYLTRSLQLNRERLLLLLTLSMLMAFLTSRASDRWHDGFAAHYSEIFGTNIFVRLQRDNPEGVRVAVLWYRHYPFFGSARKNHILRPSQVFTVEDFQEVLTGDFDYVVIMAQKDGTYGRYRNREVWSKSIPSNFRVLESGDEFTVYQVDRGIGTRP